jgi:hypothetical protein
MGSDAKKIGSVASGGEGSVTPVTLHEARSLCASSDIRSALTTFKDQLTYVRHEEASRPVFRIFVQEGCVVSQTHHRDSSQQATLNLW